MQRTPDFRLQPVASNIANSTRRLSQLVEMSGRVRLSVVGAAGTLPSKCPKCTVDAVVLVEPQHAALARAAINKLRLKVRDVERVKLVLKSAVREHNVV